MINLLKETKEILAENGKKLSDIKWVGGYTREGFCEWDVKKFLKVANNSYDNGYGSPEVSMVLTVVGEDWYLERREYDGAEWWEFCTFPKRPEKKADFNKYDIFLDYDPDEEPEWED